jgi:hypothetical protein
MEKVFQKLYAKIKKHFVGMDPISVMIEISRSPARMSFLPLSKTTV